MKRYFLDTSAFLALRDNEDGADTVADILRMALSKKANCLACFLTLMEIFYRVWKDEGEHEGRIAYEQVQSLPVVWIHESRELLEKAAEIKATHGLSLADSWIGACAILNDGILVHKDPEFDALQCDQLKLPYKK
jgi:predicted nucleic acid-binding protein